MPRDLWRNKKTKNIVVVTKRKNNLVTVIYQDSGYRCYFQADEFKKEFERVK